MEKNSAIKADKIMKLLEMKYCSTIVKRLICVILLAFEIEKVTISKKLKLSMKSVKKYENMLNKDKLTEILSIKGNSRKSELEDYKDEIFAELDAGEYKTLRQISAMIESKTGLVRSRQRVNVFLKKTNTVQSKQDSFRRRQTLPSSASFTKTY